MHLDGHLTPREKTCLHLSAQGISNLAIAGFLDIHERTVEKIRESIFKKLGCKNICEAVALGIRYDGSFYGRPFLCAQTPSVGIYPSMRISNGTPYYSTDDVRVLTKQAKQCLKALFKTKIHYQKCGVLLADLSPKGHRQNDLFEGSCENT